MSDQTTYTLEQARAMQRNKGWITHGSSIRSLVSHRLLILTETRALVKLALDELESGNRGLCRIARRDPEKLRCRS
jgi:hypothetical protein